MFPRPQEYNTADAAAPLPPVTTTTLQEAQPARPWTLQERGVHSPFETARLLDRLGDERSPHTHHAPTVGVACGDLQVPAIARINAEERSGVSPFFMSVFFHLTGPSQKSDGEGI